MIDLWASVAGMSREQILVLGVSVLLPVMLALLLIRRMSRGPVPPLRFAVGVWWSLMWRVVPVAFALLFAANSAVRFIISTTGADPASVTAVTTPVLSYVIGAAVNLWALRVALGRHGVADPPPLVRADPVVD